MRTFSTTFWPALVFITIEHDSLLEPIRIDYVLNGDTYVEFPFEVVRVSWLLTRLP